jgi:hypothetical protein
MEHLTIISTEKLESFEKELSEIKKILNQNKKEEELNQWLSKKEAKTKLKVCLKTLDNYLSKGVIPYSRFAGKIYLKANDIEAHLQNNYISK